jgi:phenylacetate-CoA ligase
MRYIFLCYLFFCKIFQRIKNTLVFHQKALNPLAYLGISHNKAEKLALHAEKNIIAYQHYLSTHRYKNHHKFTQRPILDKDNYLLTTENKLLLDPSNKKIFSIVRSSGSSGRSFYWPQLINNYRLSETMLRVFLEMFFRIHKKNTLCVVALPLGSWVAGDNFSWVLKSMSYHTSYPLTVYTPGNHQEELLNFLQNFHQAFEQIIIFIYPPFIVQLLNKAKYEKLDIPLYKMRYIATGEFFSESFRDSIDKRSQLQQNITSLLSIYGSSDTSVIGVESMASVALRKLLFTHPQIFQTIQQLAPCSHNRDVPLLFHGLAHDKHIETVDGDICVTAWQGIPLIRYKLADSALLLPWHALQTHVCEFKSEFPESAHLFNIVQQASPGLPNIIALFGRSDKTLNLYGALITETMLNSVMNYADLPKHLTGIYQASIRYDNQQIQHLHLILETHQDYPHDKKNHAQLRDKIIAGLCQFCVEFQYDWVSHHQANIHCEAEHIIRIETVAWPQLTNQQDINDIKLKRI